MKKILSYFFTAASIIFMIYICVQGFMDHWSITYVHTIVLIVLLSLASYFITQGAYDSLEDTDEEK